MKIKGIIFDLDGTLVDSIADISEAANMMLKSHGYPLHSVEDYLNWIGNGAARLIEAALPQGVNNETLEIYVKEFKSNYGRSLHNKTRVYTGIPYVLDFLRRQGIVNSVLSNKPHELTVEVVNWYLSEWNFKSVYGQRSGIPRKPDPSAALEISGIMGFECDEIMFIGDSKNDMLTATAGGFIPVGVTWGYGNENDIREGGAEYLIHEPSELIALLSA